MYISIEDLQKQVSQDTLVQLTDDALSGNIDTVVVDEAIIYSETLIDGYMRGRYVLPLNTIPAVVKILAFIKISFFLSTTLSTSTLTE